MSQPLPLLIFVRDLMFSTRITAAANQAAIPFRVVRDAEKLAQENGARLIVDLNQPGAIEAASAWKAAHHGEVIGFVSHVDTEAIARARAAGIDRILARGQFVQMLPQLLRA